jgi:hypothetical protein
MKATGIIDVAALAASATISPPAATVETSTTPSIRIGRKCRWKCRHRISGRAIEVSRGDYAVSKPRK